MLLEVELVVEAEGAAIVVHVKISSLSTLAFARLLGLGAVYIVGYLVIGIAIFGQREL